MKHFKLPFNINLERKYNDINIEKFLLDWQIYEENRKNKTITMDNDLHIELGKFATYNISLNEVVDLGLRYALGKQEFRKIAAELIELKENQNKL
ncbi:MAG: hypothetical protein QM564_11980 [Bergeyella sp.]